MPLVVDEVQTGCGRTGTWFAFEQYGIEPDVIVASKALSGIGQPVSIILYDERLDVWAPGAHTGTFRGNQVAFAAGARAVEIVRRDDVLGNVRGRSAQIRQRLDVLRTHPWVRDVRGRGLMWGIELADPATGARAGELAGRVQARALRGGLIVELGGRDDCVVRLLPPLNVTADVVDTACDILVEAVEHCGGAQRRTALRPGPPRPSLPCPSSRPGTPVPHHCREHGTAARRIVGRSRRSRSPASRTPASWSTARTRRHLRWWRPGERLEHLFEQRCERCARRDGRPARASTRRGAALTYADSTPARTSSRGTCWRAASAGRPRGAAVRRARARPTSPCWPCSRSAPPTCRWTPGSRPTASPTSSRTPRSAAVLSLSHLRGHLAQVPAPRSSPGRRWPTHRRAEPCTG